ncbi:MAG TPA: hypothetical protein VNT56_11970 [Acidimicrobiales bacterium]|jgi:ABC-type cobalamin transport system ATPase subunit|nr:hypothetical protein [Acidimicrobiales bacterium]
MTSVSVDGIDVLGWLDAELAEARAELTRQVDRTSALVEFRSLALIIAGRAGEHALTPDRLFDLTKGEEEAAHLRAVAARIAKETP